MIRAAVLLLAALAVACVPLEAPPSRRSDTLGPLPPMKVFGDTRVAPPARPNAQIARDFLDLAFRMESGRELRVFTRFEGPVRIALRGPVPATARGDLDRLIGRLRSEARIDIARARSGEAANLTIEFIPRNALQRAVPRAACFVVPRAETFAQFRRARRGGGSDWAVLTERTAATIFIPADVAPQEIRDCLHEEVAQALGPLNDLYQLPDSVFNDDNFHAVLTGFDMLVLRVTYAPELHSGMSRDAVAARLPGLLARYNPRGLRGGAEITPESRAWIAAIETALAPGTNPAIRRGNADRALQLARQSGWQDARLAFSWFVLGRTALSREANVAVAAFRQALALYDRPGTEIQHAHVAMQLAAFALTSGQPQLTIRIADEQAPVARRAENAALLASLLLLKAEALEALGHPAEARAVRLDSLGWARYGFGSDAEVRARQREITELRLRAAGTGG